MKLKTILFSIVILSALFLSAFASPGAPQTAVKYQETVQPPVATVIVEVTPGVIPVTGGDDTNSLWTLVLLGLLGLLGIAFLVALFSRRTTHEHVNRVPPHDHDI